MATEVHGDAKAPIRRLSAVWSGTAQTGFKDQRARPPCSLPIRPNRERADLGEAVALANPREFVDAAVLGQAGVDVALRVDPDPVDMAALQPHKHISLAVADA